MNNSIIVYRNPVEQYLWESGIISGVAFYLLVGLLLIIAISILNKVYISIKRKFK